MSSAIVDTIDPAAFRAILGGGKVDRLSQVPMVRFAVYRSPPFTKLLIDCDNHHATITGLPELVEPGVYTGSPDPAPYPTSGVDIRGHEGRPRRTAQIVRAGPSSAIKWPKDAAPPPDPFPVPVDESRSCSTRRGEARRGLRMMPAPPMVDGDEPRLVRVEVSDVGARFSIQLGKAGALKVRPGDRCSHSPSKPYRCPASWPPGGFPIHGRKGREQVASGTIAGKITFQPEPDRICPTSVRGRATGRSGWSGRQAMESLRVLLFPSLGHRDLFDQYDFSQPWDRAKNLRLLDRMPAVYHDPIHGDKPGRFTHYAVLVGRPTGPKLAGSNRPGRTAFAATGGK